MAPLHRPKPWLVEDPNLDALLPTADADNLEEEWFLDDVVPFSGPLEKGVVHHRVHASFPGADAGAHERDVLAHIEAMRLGPNVLVPVATFTAAPGLKTISLGPLAPWSGRPIGIALGSATGIFEMDLRTYLSPDDAKAVRTFATQIPGAKLALDLQKELHGDLVSVRYQRRQGHVPAAWFDVKRPPNPEEESKLAALDAAADPLSEEVHEKRVKIITVYIDRWEKKVATALRAHGFVADTDGKRWTAGMNAVHFIGESILVVLGEEP